MTDSLRTRIAAAMYCHEHQASRSAWDGEDEHVHDYWRAAADAVIRELQLTVLGDGIIVGAIVGESHV